VQTRGAEAADRFFSLKDERNSAVAVPREEANRRDRPAKWDYAKSKFWIIRTSGVVLVLFTWQVPCRGTPGSMCSRCHVWSFEHLEHVESHPRHTAHFSQ